MNVKPSFEPASSEPIAAVISIVDLCFSYPDQPHVLQNLSLQMQQGERVGLIGNNGCGKTTLFLLICGVLSPNSGEIFLLNQRVQPGKFLSEVGLVFQNPDDQLFSASVWDDIAFAPQNLGLTTEEVERRVSEAITLTGIQELVDRPPHHLSGGQKRMVAIAGVLAMHPQIIIYDEPTANLDLRSRRRVIQFLQHSSETLLISSHDLEFVLEVCDRVVLMDQGAIVADGRPQQILGDASLMEAYHLEIPYSLKL